MNKPSNNQPVLWSEASLQGNPFRKSCHPAMLSDKGYVVTLYPKVRKSEERTQEVVKYDRTFIAEKFVREFLVPLGLDSIQKFKYLLECEIEEALALAEIDSVAYAFAESIVNLHQNLDEDFENVPF